MMKYKLAIFDLDGTILDTLDDLADSVNYALGSVGFRARSTDEVRAFVGNGIRKLIERAVPDNTDEASVDRVFETFKAYYQNHSAVKTAPYAGIRKLLGELKAEGVKLAVLSNKADFAVQSLCVQYFDGIFDAAAGEREGIRRKPAPDALFSLLGRMGVDRSSVLYIGDSEVDIETARNAQIDCVAVDWGFRERSVLAECGAERIVSSPEELKAIIMG